MVNFIILACLLGSVVGLDNGLARTPPNGWNPYNAFACDTTEDQYRAAAYTLVQLGLKDLGYKYLNLDCGWQATSRTSSGAFQWDTTRIPSGIPALADYVHGLGLLFGVYSDGGYRACDPVNGNMDFLGSLGYEQSDAKSFTDWGADYLKYDNCFAMDPSVIAAYNAPLQTEINNYNSMREALNQTGRPVVYAICEWGVDNPARWAGDIGNSWRIANDVGPPASFASFQRIINQLVPITQYAKPGSWNDLDLLEVGNSGLTETEWAMQFAFWAAAKSPLIISTDLTIASAEVMNILSNENIIAINQDPLGASIAFKRRYTDDHDVWAGPLADGSMVAVLVNWMDTRQSIGFDLSDVGLTSAYFTDLWTGSDIGFVNGLYTASVDAHGALIYKLSEGRPATPHTFITYLACASPNKLEGGAVLRTLSDKSIVVGGLGYTGTLTIVDVDGGAAGGTKLITISYVNADYDFPNTACSNCRRVEVSVNGGAPVVAEMPLSGQDWDAMFDGYLLRLDGFVPGPYNEVKFINPSFWAPDIYSIGVQV